MKTSKIVVVALMSLTLIALEMAWTRILSAEFFYTFAFLVLSLAILGLGMGALSVRLFPFLNSEKKLGLMLSLSGMMAMASPLLVFQLGLNFSQLLASWVMVGKLILTIILLSSTFYFGGIALTVIFRNHHKEIDRLYMADMIGAGFGIILAIILMNTFGTPVATFLIAIPILISALIVSPKFQKILPLILMGAALYVSPYGMDLLEAPQRERGPVIYKHWDAMAKIKMFTYPGDEGRGIVIDNAANTPVYKFDGDYQYPDTLPKDQWGIPVGDLIHRFDNCTFLSLGAGGGADVLQALVEGAAEVHAVEVNPWLNKMLLEGDPDGYDQTYLDTTGADFKDLPAYNSGLYNNPKVTVVSEDARAYVRRFENKFDIIYSLSSNTFAALASGAFAMAENYLFTTEAFADYWYALSDSGFLMMEHQFYMPRLVTEVMDALGDIGINNPKDHFAIYNLPKMRRNALLLSKQPLTEDILKTALKDLSPESFADIHLLFPAVDSLKHNPIQQIVDRGWKAVADSMPIDISPNTDDRPFAAQLGMWRNLKLSGVERLLPYEFYGFPLTKLLIVTILLIVIVLIIPLNLLPYLRKGLKLKSAPWLFFFLIGAGYMMVEVILMQKYTLFVGPSVYSISTILMTMLIMSGIGSRFSNKFKDALPFIGIIIWLLLDIFVFRYITNALGGFSQGMRIFVTALLIAPLGFFMGMPFPKAGLKVGELVDWGFAVNGAASVLGSTLIILVVVSYGYAVGLILCALIYLGAYGLLTVKKGWS